MSWAVRQVQFGTILKYHEWSLPKISCTNHAIICLHYNLWNSVHVTPSVYFHQVVLLHKEKIGFKVLVFSPAGPDIAPDQYTFLSSSVFWIFFQFLILWISKSFHHFFVTCTTRLCGDFSYHTDYNFQMYMFQIKLKYLCSQPIKVLKFLQ